MVTAVGVARAVLGELGGSTDSYKLQKLVYYCQAWHATQTKRALFDGVIQAWKNGPVAPDLWPLHKGRYWVTESMLPRADGAAAPDEYERTVIRAVTEHYGGMDSQALVELTHSEDPWQRVFEPGKNNAITTDSMRSYYATVLASNQPSPALPNAGVRYVTAAEFDVLMADADHDAINVGLAAAFLRQWARD